ncbi:MAG: hypothetical protein WEE50_04855 [Chloroflexota bacterium]
MTECPSCGANLVPDSDQNLPGLTAVDAASIIRSKSPPQPRSRLMSWLSGEYATDLPSKAEHQAIAPPDLEVRREILRLELEAEVANLQAEADALRAEAAAEGRSVEALDAALAAATGVAEGAPEAAVEGAAPIEDAAPIDDPAVDGGADPVSSSAPESNAETGNPSGP